MAGASESVPSSPFPDKPDHRAAQVSGLVRGLHCTERMWILLGILLVAGWLVLKLVWNVAAFGVHLLLVAAVIALVVHFVRGRFGGRDSSA
jgi:type IV secretory pathway TrbD component